MFELASALMHHTFIQNAVAAAILSSIACGVTGTFVVIRRLTYLGGGIAHTALGGLGIALFLGVSPMLGALGFALAAAMLFGWVTLRFREHEDTVISALWSVGMAVGIVFIQLTPGYNINLFSFLFGNILMVTRGSLLLLGAVDAVILIVVAVLFRQLVAVAFDTEYASLRGIPASVLYLVILSMVALTVVILIQTVGLILVIALLTLPPSTARLMTKTTGAMMVWSVALSLLFTMLGLVLSFALNIPSGASIILVAGAGWFGALGLSRLKRLKTAS